MFLEALRLFGRSWKAIETHIGTKTAVQIRSHAQKHFQKIQREKVLSQEDCSGRLQPTDGGGSRKKTQTVGFLANCLGYASDLLPFQLRVHSCINLLRGAKLDGSGWLRPFSFARVVWPGGLVKRKRLGKRTVVRARYPESSCRILQVCLKTSLLLDQSGGHRTPTPARYRGAMLGI